MYFNPIIGRCFQHPSSHSLSIPSYLTIQGHVGLEHICLIMNKNTCRECKKTVAVKLRFQFDRVSYINRGLTAQSCFPVGRKLQKLRESAEKKIKIKNGFQGK